MPGPDELPRALKPFLLHALAKGVEPTMPRPEYTIRDDIDYFRRHILPTMTAPGVRSYTTPKLDDTGEQLIQVVAAMTDQQRARLKKLLTDSCDALASAMLWTPKAGGGWTPPAH